MSQLDVREVEPPAATAAPQRWLGVASLAGRVLLTAVFGYAALTKIGDPAATVRAVRAYQLLPEALAVPVGYALPAVELALAALLLLGVATRLMALFSSVLMLVFIAGVASAWARGLKIDCGCFGGGGVTDNPQYALELFRDGAILAVAAAVVLIPRSRFALDPTPVAAMPTFAAAGATRVKVREQRMAQGRQAAASARHSSRVHRLRFIALALLALAALVGIIAGNASKPPARQATPPGVTAAGGVIVGQPTAPRHLVVYSDPQCPICVQFEQTSSDVLARAVAAGTVRVEYRMRSFLGPESVRAVAALGAALPLGKFDQLRIAIYANQPQKHTGGYTVEDLLALGAGVGLTDPAYADAVRSQTYAGWARAIDEQGSRDGNVGTPELRLDGLVLPPAVSFDPIKLASALGL